VPPGRAKVSPFPLEFSSVSSGAHISMPRKKKKNVSVATTSAPLDSGSTDVESLTINQSFAKKYETAKRKELLANLPAATFDEESSTDDEEDEDEHAVLLTKKMDRLVRNTIVALRSKDPSIYDKNTIFFEQERDDDARAAEDSNSADSESGEGSGEEYDSNDEPVAGWEAIARAAEGEATKGLTLKDYVRENLLADGRLSDSDSGDELEIQRDDGEVAGRKVRFEDATGSSQERHGKPKMRAVSGSAEPKVVSEDRTGGGDAEDGSEEGGDDDDFFKKMEKSQVELLEEDKDFDKFLKKEMHSKRNRAGDDLLLHAYLERETPDEKERFLQDFVLNNGWLDRSAGAAPLAADYSIEVDKTDMTKPLTVGGNTASDAEHVHGSDSEFEDKVDDFEHKYNFRFEEPDGAKVVSHARHIEGSLRRPDDRRKRAREARKERRQHEKIVKTEDIKQLKNLKSREIEARLVALQEAAGDGVDFSGIDLDADFDPEDFSMQMEARFGENYYSVKDMEMKGADDDGAANATSGLPGKDIEPEVAEDVNRLVEAYYNLDYEDIIGGTPVRFNYKKVDSESFGMDPNEILKCDDKELNRKASLKYLAPYRKKPWRGPRSSIQGRDGSGVASARVQSMDTKRDSATKRKRDRPCLQAESALTNDREGEVRESKPTQKANQTSEGKRRKSRKSGDIDGTMVKRESDYACVKSELSPILEESAAAGSVSHRDNRHMPASAHEEVDTFGKPKKKKKKQRRRDRLEEVASSLTSARRAAYGLS
jgi:protein KRI1